MAKSTKLTLSPTKISAFLRCRRFYWFRYIQKYQTRPRAEFTFGAALHRSLDAFHGATERPTVETLQAQFREGWTTAGFKTPEEAQRALEAAQGILEKYHQEAPPPEAAPEILLREKMLRVDCGEYVLMGRVDRVDRHPDGTLEIIDYKSGRSRVTESQTRADIGLMVYEAMIRRLYPDSRVTVSIHALRPNQRATIARTDGEFAEVLTFIDDTAHAIAAETDWEGVCDKDLCEDCDFLRWCPDRWPGRDADQMSNDNPS
ncbi:MAG: PD-(D/E)XK nuclease family protein [Armatimonadetes bacterium]|jgi:RecB family exonuclease|nr:PD-(D/E)XK nuclease family protein [Armatimonadota bacterium]